MTLIKKSIWLALAATFPMAASAAGGPAATIDLYQNGGPLTDQTSKSPIFHGDNGLSVTARAYDRNGTQIDVAIRWDGIGATGGLLSAGELNSSAFNNPGEFLTLTFNQAVTLSGLQFSQWENGVDKAVLYWGNNFSNSLTLGNSGSVLDSVDSFSLSNITGTTFKIQATGLASAFRLAGINATPAIPEPGTYALMGLGLAGIGLVARRQQRRS